MEWDFLSLLDRFDLGVAFRVKYGHLLKGFTDTLPVFRTTSNGEDTGF